MVKNTIIYTVTLVIFLILDSVWLGLVAPKLYKKYIGHLMAKKPNFTAAAIFYSLFVLGLLVFVIVPALNMQSLQHALVYGSMFGFFTYVTFDLTSQAVFKNWPTTISIIDILWGTTLALATSTISYLILFSHF